MKFATSAGVALALSFLFYDQRDLATGEELSGPDDPRVLTGAEQQYMHQGGTVFQKSY